MHEVVAVSVYFCRIESALNRGKPRTGGGMFRVGAQHPLVEFPRLFALAADVARDFLVLGKLLVFVIGLVVAVFE
ncbi:hypothetical protein GCM10029978_027150 [Actinoallomurus acanthiterrae]